MQQKKRSRKKKKLVSIIMTCYNGQRYLRKAVQSILNQTYKNWELIFYNNCSSDKSENIIRSYQDKRIKYFKTENLKSLGKIRNLAFNKAKGTYVAFLDVDDYWHKEKLKLQTIKFASNKKIDVIYCNLNKKIDHKIINNRINFEKGYCQNKIIKSYIDMKPLTSWLTLMVKKKSIKKLNYPFDEKLHITSDFDLIIRLSEFAYFDYIPKILCTYRVHGSNESKNKMREISELAYLLKKYKKNQEIDKILSYKNFSNKIFIKNLFYKAKFI